MQLISGKDVPQSEVKKHMNHPMVQQAVKRVEEKASRDNAKAKAKKSPYNVAGRSHGERVRGVSID